MAAEEASSFGMIPISYFLSITYIDVTSTSQVPRSQPLPAPIPEPASGVSQGQKMRKRALLS
jgi:hypothetical protein